MSTFIPENTQEISTFRSSSRENVLPIQKFARKIIIVFRRSKWHARIGFAYSRNFKGKINR